MSLEIALKVQLSQEILFFPFSKSSLVFIHLFSLKLMFLLLNQLLKNPTDINYRELFPLKRLSITVSEIRGTVGRNQPTRRDKYYANRLRYFGARNCSFCYHIPVSEIFTNKETRFAEDSKEVFFDKTAVCTAQRLRVRHFIMLAKMQAHILKGFLTTILILVVNFGNKHGTK